MSLLNSGREKFDSLMAGAAAPEKEVRAAAWRRMETLGLPGRRTETWKYSSLAAVDRVNWSLPQAGATAAIPEAWREWLAALASDFDILACVGGEPVRELCRLPSAIQVRAADLSGARFEGEDGFADLNLAIANPGYAVVVAADVKCERPLVIFRYQDQADEWVPVFNQVYLGAGAGARVVEVFAGNGPSYLRSDLNEVRVGTGGRLTWVRMQSEAPGAHHFNDTQVQVEAGGHFHFTQINRGARWQRSQMRVSLNGPEAAAEIQGLTVGANDQHSDQRVVLMHNSAHTRSEQLFKGIYKDRSRGTVNGKIFIARDAQKVESRQLNHNLLLSPTAEANTKPELEIYADDVKANHGATVGRLDAEKLFYLQSRGLSKAAAEELLSAAFAGDIFMKIPDARMRSLVEVNNGP